WFLETTPVRRRIGRTIEVSTSPSWTIHWARSGASSPGTIEVENCPISFTSVISMYWKLTPCFGAKRRLAKLATSTIFRPSRLRVLYKALARGEKNSESHRAAVLTLLKFSTYHRSRLDSLNVVQPMRSTI